MQHHGTHIKKSLSMSPPKNRRPVETMEWKRRLLGKDSSPSAPNDLFSPIRLENMFRPPTPRGKPIDRISPQSTLAQVRSSPTRPDVLEDTRKETQLGNDTTETEKTNREGARSLEEPQQRKGHMVDESRKGSVQTRDFLDEAERVMELIRARGNPDRGFGPSKRRMGESHGMPDIEEDAVDESGFEVAYESTLDRFSRPPSRNQNPMAAPHPMIQTDPKILEYLRGYADTQELESTADPATRPTTDADRTSRERLADQGSLRSGDRSVINHDLKIRINEDAGRQAESRSATGIKVGGRTAESSAGQHSTSRSGDSSSRTLRTGSSTRTDAKVVIAPQAVTHLVAGEIAGMTFDHHKQVWLKRKATHNDNGAPDAPLFSEDSTEDPFRNIPDLTVDEVEELNIMRGVCVQAETRNKAQVDRESVARTITPRSDRAGAAELEGDAEDEPGQLGVAKSSSTTGRAAADNRPPEESIVVQASGETNFGPKSSERITDAGSVKGCLSRTAAGATRLAEPVEEVEAEIQAHEGREPEEPAFGRRRPKRDVTITFSSPLVSRSFQIPAQGPCTEEDEDAHLSAFVSQPEPATNSVLEPRHAARDLTHSEHATFRFGAPVASENSMFGQRRGQLSTMGRTVLNRSISCFNEESMALSNINVNHSSIGISKRTSRGFAPATPRRPTGPHDGTAQRRWPTAERLSHVTFHLSPLPDFTVNQPDESLAHEVGRLEKGPLDFPRTRERRTLSLVTLDLVRRLTDLEPYEPYWEHIRQLDLSNSGLIAFHGLVDFCSRLEKLDASHNRAGQLNGVPSSVRLLRLTNNCLSGLTTYGHLQNLHYLDVSYNEIDSLGAIQGLVHLRELKAGHNLLSSLEGVLDLDGLLKLDIRGNEFKTLDFAGSKLGRLLELDARGNDLTEVLNLKTLETLKSANFDDNALTSLNLGGPTVLLSLRSLSLNNNQLKILNLDQTPHLRLLRVDGNRIKRLVGLHTAMHLECLSMRDQGNDAPGGGARPSVLDECQDIRTLRLSANIPPSFNSGVNYLSLQHLELASCGLRSLPASFGRTFTNVRVLNLNFNAISDIKPLEGIVRLSRLMLASNRISHMRTAINTLSGFRTLKELDTRYNPFTLGFHPLVDLPRNSADTLDYTDEGSATSEPDPFALPSLDPEVDRAHRKRSDEATRLCRRAYDLLLWHRCKSLRIVDGLSFTCRQPTDTDLVWRGLVVHGVIPDAPALASPLRESPCDWDEEP